MRERSNCSNNSLNSVRIYAVGCNFTFVMFT